MHSWAFTFRKSTSHIQVLAPKTLFCRFISGKPNTPLVESSRRYYKNEGDESIMRSVSYGVVVFVGSTLVVCDRDSFADAETQTEKKKKSSFLFKDSYRKKVFFKYEKRIRTLSPPEKVFDYFASYKKMPSGEAHMTASDLMRAVVPVFPPSETDAVRGGYLDGEQMTSELHCPPSEFFMLFDTDNDGLISFPEYIFFVTLLSIPESSFSVAFKMFDIDNDGGIDKQEFKKVMSLMRSQNRQGASHSDGKRSGLKVSGSVEDGGLLEFFFGKDGTQKLEHDKFVQFLKDLQDEMLRLEFAHYDFKSQGSISAKDFVLSVITSADMRYIDKFLDQVDELNNEPTLKDTRITFEEFKNFALLRKKLGPFSTALFSYGKVNGLLSKQDFKRAAKQVCGISLTDKVVDLIYYMFDANKDGNLSSDEFLRVLERTDTQLREGGVAGLISCWWACTKNCPSKKLF